MVKKAVDSKKTSHKLSFALETEWNFASFFKGDDDPQIEKEKARIEEEGRKFINKWKDRQDYLEEPRILAEALKEYEQWKRFTGLDGKVGFYFSLRQALDEANPELKAKIQKIDDFANKILNDIQFFNLRLGKISQEKQAEFLASQDLVPYKHHLERIFIKAKYQLSEAEEKIMNLKASSAYSAWVQMVSGLLSKEEREVVDEDGKRKKKSFEEIMNLTQYGKTSKIRDGAAKVFNQILLDHSDAAEAEMNAIINDKKIDDELRGLPKPETARHLRDDIDSEVVESMIQAVSSRNDIPRKFYEFKAKLLKLPKLKYNERNLPYGKIDKKYSYEDAVSLTYDVFSKLDSEFAEVLKHLSENGQIDVYPRKGKGGGAFCAHDLLVSPTYVLLNFAGKFRDVSTIAHEFGHAINYELMKEKQNAINFGTTLSTAEVASTFMEDFVFEELMQKSSEEERLALQIMKLNDDVSTIFRQVAFYQFEQELHAKVREKGYLSKEEIGVIFQKHMADYMGSAVEQTKGSENWWIYVSHFRRFFYVYSYASGLLISKSLQAAVKRDHHFIGKVKEFLTAGMSESPKNIFAKMDIGITDKKFWEKGILEIDGLLNETQKLAKKLGKI
jgi:oligoendopeptidase F